MSDRYPPMTPLPAGAPVWPPDDALTPIRTPDAARLTLRAEAETSVLDPAGMRRLWVRELAFVVAVCVAVLAGVALVRNLGSDRLPGWWLPLMLATVAVNLGFSFVTALCRALPHRGVLPPLGPARLRWYVRVRREPVVVPPPAAWPAGAEAYAVLSGAASVVSVTPSWLCERVGLSPAVGPQWVALLRQRGWLTGGDRTLGIGRLPETHLVVTKAGRQRLADERARLQALAAG